MKLKTKRGILLPPQKMKPASKYSWDIERDGLTQSAIAKFVSCPMKARLALVNGLQRIGEQNDALDFGNLFHEVLEKVYSGRLEQTTSKTPDLTPSIDYMKYWNNLVAISLRNNRDRMEKLLTFEEMQKYEVVFGLCAVVLEQYFSWWKKEDLQHKVIAVEKEFSFPFRVADGVIVPIRGKIDMIYQTSDGNLVIGDHKTKKEIEDAMSKGSMSVGAVIETMPFNLQMTLYSLAVKYLYGKYPKSILYNLVKRPGQIYKGTFNRKPESVVQYLERVRKDIEQKSDHSSGKRTSNYFLRYNVSVSEDEIKNWRDNDLFYIVNQMYGWAKNNNEKSFRNSAACKPDFLHTCEYLDICGNNDRSRYRTRLKVFNELECKNEIKS